MDHEVDRAEVQAPRGAQPAATNRPDAFFKRVCWWSPVFGFEGVQRFKEFLNSLAFIRT